MKLTPLPSRDRMLELLHYDPETGIFRWKMRGVDRHDSLLAGAIAGCVDDETGYRTIRFDGCPWQAHRLAYLVVYGWCPPKLDHRDTHPDHNAIDNLRPATGSQNAGNARRHRNKASGLPKGVFSEKEGRYRARIRHENQSVNLGTFRSPELAHAAYVEAAARLFGKFARSA